MRPSIWRMSRVGPPTELAAASITCPSVPNPASGVPFALNRSAAKSFAPVAVFHSVAATTTFPSG